MSEGRTGDKGFHIPSLDGVRAVSITIVALAHGGLKKMPGGFGVTVFFFLSGFLITTLLRIEREKTGALSLRNFYIRRLFRIPPPFYLVLGVAIALTAGGILEGGLDAGHILALVCHIGNYWPIGHTFVGQPHGTSVYWSLAVEEHFYVAFPLFFVWFFPKVERPLGRAALLWTICGVMLLWRCVLVFALHAPVERTYLATDTRADSILFGCALALWGNPVLDPPPWSDALLKRLLVPLALVAILATFLVRGDVFRETFRYSIQGIALHPLFVYCMRFPTSLAGRVLNQRAVAYFGVLSYGYYLVHLVVQEGLDDHFPGWPLLLRLAVCVAISLSLAYAMHLGVEKPLGKLRQRFLRRRPAQPSAVAT